MRSPATMLMIFAVGLVLWLLVGLRPGARRRFSARWIRDQSAPISPELATEVEDTRWRRRAGGMIGALLGLVILLPISLRFDPADDQSLALNLAAVIIPIMLAFIGEGVAGLTAAVREVRGSVRVAHPRATRLTDYVSRAGLVIMRVEVAVIVAAGLAAIRLTSRAGIEVAAGEWALLWGVVVGVSVVWAVTELVARRLVAHPIPSSDARSLFWREALRAEQLREVCRLPTAVGYLAPTVILSALPGPYAAPAASTVPDRVFAFGMLTIALTLAAQLCLMRAPDNRHRKAMLLHVRRSYENA